MNHETLQALYALDVAEVGEEEAEKRNGLTESELNAAGKKLYDECVSVKPDWSILGSHTKALWNDRARLLIECRTKEIKL